MQNQYWATKDTNELASELTKKIDIYDTYLVNSGTIEFLRDSYTSFYGDHKIRDLGASGELKGIKINHYASLIRNLISLVTNQRPAWQPIASNTDIESQSATILASSLLDFYMKNNRLERTFKNAALMASFLKEGWVSTTWDTNKGNLVAVDPDTQIPIHEGDLDFKLHTLNDIIRDVNKRDMDFEWLIVREYKNKHDLIIQFPEFADKIAAQSMDKTDMNKISIKQSVQDDTDSDLIPVFTFYHKICASLPSGRMAYFIQDQILWESQLAYEKIPVFRISAEDIFEDCFGHTPASDLLPIQKAIDTLASTLLTNNVTFGVQNIVADKNSGVSVTQLNGGMNLIEKNSGTQISALQLTASAPETYKFFDVLIQQGQLLSGVNDAIRGQAPSGTSGAALALLSQQAIQFANGLQQGWSALIEDVGTSAIQTLQKYANTKRVAVLSGKNHRSLLKEWSKADLQGVSRVTIEQGNPFSKTAAGRIQIAQDLLQNGMIENPAQYLTVLTTGQLEPIYESENRQLMLIRAENEKLSDGQAVRALLTDNHDMHILEHASVLSSPETRDNPDSATVINTLAHIQEHLNLKQSMPPDLAALLKQSPSMQQPPMQGGQSNIPQAMSNTPPIETEAGEVNGPSMPTNKATGLKFDPNNNGQ